jgi:hypothetical protein
MADHVIEPSLRAGGNPKYWKRIHRRLVVGRRLRKRGVG